MSADRTASAGVPVGLISYDDENGVRWRVWHVETPAAQAHLMDANFRSGWLVFEREDGLERRRLSQVPDDWASLSPRQLDSLRHTAMPATTPRSGTTQQLPPAGDEKR